MAEGFQVVFGIVVINRIAEMDGSSIRALSGMSRAKTQPPVYGPGAGGHTPVLLAWSSRGGYVAWLGPADSRPSQRPLERRPGPVHGWAREPGQALTGAALSVACPVPPVSWPSVHGAWAALPPRQ